MSAPDADLNYYKNTGLAERNRTLKVHALALYAFRHNLTPEDLGALSPERARAFARASDVSPPSEHGGQTWMLTAERLGVLLDHKDSPNAPKLDLWRRGRDWKAPVSVADGTPGLPEQPSTAAPEPDPAPVVVEHDAPAREIGFHNPDEPLAEPPPRVRRHLVALPLPVPVDDAAVDAPIPRGWAELATLPPLTRADARCYMCGEPAIRGCLDRWRCAKHPPRAGEWGAKLNWTPNERHLSPGVCSGPCYCGRCPHHQLAPSTAARDETAENARHRAKGSRR